MTAEDPLLERIDQVLAECEADERAEPATSVPYVGFDEPPLVEPRADQMRGWLARWIGRWSR